MFSVKDYDIPKSEEQCRTKLKELFLKNKEVTDIRVIDLLVIKVNNEAVLFFLMLYLSSFKKETIEMSLIHSADRNNL